MRPGMSAFLLWLRTGKGWGLLFLSLVGWTLPVCAMNVKSSTPRTFVPGQDSVIRPVCAVRLNTSASLWWLRAGNVWGLQFLVRLVAVIRPVSAVRPSTSASPQWPRVVKRLGCAALGQVCWCDTASLYSLRPARPLALLFLPKLVDVARPFCATRPSTSGFQWWPRAGHFWGLLFLVRLNAVTRPVCDGSRVEPSGKLYVWLSGQMRHGESEYYRFNPWRRNTWQS